MSKQNDPQPGTSKTNPGSKDEIASLKRELEEMREKNRKLEAATPDIKKAKIFEDFVTENETLQASARRRLKHQHMMQPHLVVATIRNISKEASPHLTEEMKKMMKEISNDQWPLSIKPCLDFNTGGCVKTFNHLEKSKNKSQPEEYVRLHICSICMELFKIGVYHPAYDCQTLRLIDEKIKIEDQKMAYRLAKCSTE